MRTFGIIGFPLSHSFSQSYFTQKFIADHISDAVFKSFPIENIDALQNVLQSEPELKGLAVTIPYKKQVLSFLQAATNDVKAMAQAIVLK